MSIEEHVDEIKGKLDKVKRLHQEGKTVEAYATAQKIEDKLLQLFNRLNNEIFPVERTNFFCNKGAQHARR